MNGGGGGGGRGRPFVRAAPSPRGEPPPPGSGAAPGRPPPEHVPPPPPRPRRGPQLEAPPRGRAGGPGALPPYLTTGAGAAGASFSALPGPLPGRGCGAERSGVRGGPPPRAALPLSSPRSADAKFRGRPPAGRAGRGEAGGEAEAARGMRGAGSAATLQRLQESLPREAAHHPRPAALIGCGAGRRPLPANRPAPTMGGAAAPASPIPRPRGPRPPRRAGPAGGSAGGFPAARRSSTPWARRAGSSGDRRGAGSRLARGCQGGGELGARCRCRAWRCAALPLRRARPAEPWQWSGCAARGERTVRVRR